MGLTVSTLLRDSPQRAKVCPQPLSTLARQSFPTAIHTSIGTPIFNNGLIRALEPELNLHSSIESF
jgi:hypothetical protein